MSVACLTGAAQVSGQDGVQPQAGTTGYIPVWTGTNTLGNSSIFQAGASRLGIGTLSPGAGLDVQSTGIAISGLTSTPQGAGVRGVTTDESCFNEPCSAGLYGFAKNIVHNSGVFGVAYGISGTGHVVNNGAGVWGDTSAPISAAIAVLGTTDDNSAVVGLNNSEFESAGMFVNYNNSGSSTLYTASADGNGYCNFDTGGNMTCTGSKSAVVTVNNGRKVALYAVESTENWFEDFGSGQLSSGVISVNLDPAFLQTVNAGVEYHVFLTPNGDCRGLYVAQKTPTGFVVRELGGGTSSIAFDYRITAKRRGFESVRLADQTAVAARLAAAIPKPTDAAAGTH
jgi:hypothetical protein